MARPLLLAAKPERHEVVLQKLEDVDGAREEPPAQHLPVAVQARPVPCVRGTVDQGAELRQPVRLLALQHGVATRLRRPVPDTAPVRPLVHLPL